MEKKYIKPVRIRVAMLEESNDNTELCLNELLQKYIKQKFLQVQVAGSQAKKYKPVTSQIQNGTNLKVCA